MAPLTRDGEVGVRNLSGDHCGYKEANNDRLISVKSGLRGRVVHRVWNGEVIGSRPTPNPHEINVVIKRRTMTARSLLKVAYVAVWFTGSGRERLAFDPPPTP